MKDKRMIVQSLKDTLKRQFDMIVRETDRQDDMRVIVVSAVSLSDTKDVLYTLWEKVLDHIESRYSIRIAHDAVSVIQGEV